MSSHGGSSHSSGGSSGGGPSGLKIPKRFLLIVGLTFLTFCIAWGIAPAVGASEKQTLLWSLGLSLLSGGITLWATKTGGHHGSHGGGHGHGRGIKEWLEIVVTLLVIGLLGAWLIAYSWRNFGPEADEIKNARRESEEQTRQVIKGLADKGILGGYKIVTAEVGDSTPPPRTKTYTVPPNFSEPLYFSYPEKGSFEVEGTPGPLYIWDGEKIWLVGAGETGVNLKGGALAFRSATNHPIRIRVYRTPNNRL
jgi:hypothetical protein